MLARAAGIQGGLSLTVWSALVAPLPLLCLSLLLDGPHTVATALGGLGWQSAVSTLYTAGLSSLVGYGIFNSLLARYPSSLVVPWVLIVPVVAMASAWALLGQSPNGAESAGGALLLAGAFVALRPRRISRDAKAALAQPVPVSASVRNALSMPCSGAM